MAIDEPVAPAPPVARRTLGIALAVLCGVGGALQARINGQLGVRLHDGIAAAVISFGIGLLLVSTMTVLLPAGRRGVRALVTALRSGTLAPWQCLGGLCGAAYVASQGISAAPLGVAVFTVTAVAGQTVSSLAVDRMGLGPTDPHPITGARGWARRWRWPRSRWRPAEEWAPAGRRSPSPPCRPSAAC